MSTMSSSQTLVIGKQRVNIEAISYKVGQDIAFLTDRISRMKNQQSPNEVVLQTYESMLASRQSVLEWLEQHGHQPNQTISVLEQSQ